MGLLLLLTVLCQPPLSARPDSLDLAPKPLRLALISVHREPDRWFALDKFWHFSASFVTVGAAYHFGRNRANLSEPLSTGIATGGTLTLGVTKEFYDLAGPAKHFSWKDLVADAAGVCVGYFAFIHHF